MQPLVTVLTPAYNRAGFIAEAVESVLNQSYGNIEYIVVDDGSSDGTFEILQEYEAAGKLTLLTHENHSNRGQSAALNVGLRAANGRYLVILDSDDLLGSHLACSERHLSMSAAMSALSRARRRCFGRWSLG